MKGDGEPSQRFTELTSLSSLHPTRFNFPVISIGSCNTCGSLDHLDDDCPRSHWTIQQHFDFYLASSSYTGEIEEPDFLDNAVVSNDFSDDAYPVPQSCESCSVGFDCIICYGDHKIDDCHVQQWSYDQLVTKDVVQNTMSCASHACNFRLMKNELEDIALRVSSKFDNTALVLELKVDLASSRTLQAACDLLFSEQYTWPTLSGHLELMSYSVLAGWYEFEISQGTKTEGKFHLAILEERGCWRPLTNIEISFLWYQDGFSEHLAESG